MLAIIYSAVKGPLYPYYIWIRLIKNNCYGKGITNTVIIYLALTEMYRYLRSSRSELFLENLFYKYAANLQEYTHAEVWFQRLVWNYL